MEDEQTKRRIIDDFNAQQRRQMMLWKFKKRVQPNMQRHISIVGGIIVMHIPHNKPGSFINGEIDGFTIYSFLVKKKETIILFRESEPKPEVCVDDLELVFPDLTRDSYA